MANCDTGLNPCVLPLFSEFSKGKPAHNHDFHIIPWLCKESDMPVSWINNSSFEPFFTSKFVEHLCNLLLTEIHCQTMALLHTTILIWIQHMIKTGNVHRGLLALTQCCVPVYFIDSDCVFKATILNK